LLFKFPFLRNGKYDLTTTCQSFNKSIKAACVLQDISGLTVLNIRPGGTEFELFREHIGHLHFAILRYCNITPGRLLDKLLQVIAQ